MLHQRIPYTSPAAAVIANVLSGTAIEFITRASNLKVFATADAAGDTFGLSMTMGGDSRVLIPAGSSINLASAAGAGPKLDEDFYGEWPIPAGAHLVLSYAGTAAHTGRFAFEVNP
jgi:hypothetical protein